jgi:hypothetical protein
MWRRGPPLTPATLPAPFRPKNLGRGLCGDSLRMSLTAVFRPRPCSLGNAPACLLDGVAYVLRDGPGCAYKTQAFLARTGEDGPSETLPADAVFEIVQSGIGLPNVLTILSSFGPAQRLSADK